MRRHILPLAAALAMAMPAAAAEYTLRIGSGHPVQIVNIGLADTFFVPEVIRRVKEKTGDDIKFTTAWAGTVAKPEGVSEAVEAGILDIGISAVNFEPSRLDLLNFGFYLPFTTPDHVLNAEVAMRMVRELPVLQESVDRYGITILNLSVGENYGLILKDEYSGLGSLQGRRLACGSSNTAWAEAVGAVCIVASTSEHYQGLQTGLLDGVIGFTSWVVAFRLDEIVKEYVRTDFGPLVAAAMLMNDATRARLPAEVVAIIDEVAAEHAVQAALGSKQRDEATAAAAQAKGVKVSALPDEDRRVWAEALKNVPAAAAADMEKRGLAGAEVFKAYVRMLAESGYTFPVEHPL